MKRPPAFEVLVGYAAGITRKRMTRKRATALLRYLEWLENAVENPAWAKREGGGQ